MKNFYLQSLLDKAVRKTRGIIVSRTRYHGVYLYLYKSYWHLLFHKCSNEKSDVVQYYSACPNPGAGIGHQISNWNSGYWWAKQFGLNFAHIPFRNPEWEWFLGLGNGEILVKDLILSKEYVKRRLPKFDDDNEKELRIQRDIITSYAGKKIVFIAEQDQRYHNQYGVMNDLQKKFYNAPARNKDKLIYCKNHYNIAIHVRRGDIMESEHSGLYKLRFLPEKYYYKVLKQMLLLNKQSKPVHIYLFSQGSPDDFPMFKEFDNLHWCFEMDARQSFLHLIFADLLITSKSSFSYKPALLNKGIKACPKSFWHSYPDTEDWVLFDDEGNIVRTIV